MPLKKTVLLALVSFFFISAFSQGRAKSFTKLNELNISVEELDKTFHPALSEDSTQSIFHPQDAFIKAYQTLLQDLNSFLSKNNFAWSKPTRCFNRIYFAPEGRIEYFLFHFNQNDISKEQEKSFEILVTQFIQGYTFPLQANARFAQCSPVIYKP